MNYNGWNNDFGVWDDGKGEWLWRISSAASEAPLSHSAILPRSGNLIGVQQNHIAIVDIRTGKALGQFPGNSFKAHRDGDLLAVIGKGTVEIWSLQKQTRIATFEGDQCSFGALTRIVAIRTKKDTTTIWELPQRKVSEFQAGTTVTFSPDGRRVVASLGESVVILDPITGKGLKLRGRSDNFAFSPDGRIIASLSGKTVKFWVADPAAAGPDGS